MAVSSEFEASCGYSSQNGIEVSNELCVGNQKIELIATLATGAAHCIFERRYAEELRLHLEGDGCNVSELWRDPLKHSSTRS